MEPNQNEFRQNKMIKDKRDLFHSKDNYYLTDTALKAICEYVPSKKNLFSLKKIERLRKKQIVNFLFYILKQVHMSDLNMLYVQLYLLHVNKTKSSTN